MSTLLNVATRRKRAFRTIASRNVVAAANRTAVEGLQNTTEDIVVSLTRTNYRSGVTVTVAGLPTGVTATVTPGTAYKATNTITVQLAFAVDAPVVTNDAFTITVTSGIQTQTINCTVTVTASGGPVTGDFALTLFPAAATLGNDSEQTVFVDIQRNSGFGGAVTLAASGLPTGVTAVYPNGSVWPVPSQQTFAYSLSSGTVEWSAFAARVPRGFFSASAPIADHDAIAQSSAASIDTPALTGGPAGGRVVAFLGTDVSGDWTTPSGWTAESASVSGGGQVSGRVFSRDAVTTLDEAIAGVTFNRTAGTRVMSAVGLVVNPGASGSPTVEDVQTASGADGEVVVTLPLFQHGDLIIIGVAQDSGSVTSAASSVLGGANNEQIDTRGTVEGTGHGTAYFIYQAETRTILRLVSTSSTPIVAADAYALQGTATGVDPVTVNGTVTTLAAVTPHYSTDVEAADVGPDGDARDLNEAGVFLWEAPSACRVTSDQEGAELLPVGLSASHSPNKFLRFRYPANADTSVHVMSEQRWYVDPFAGPYVNAGPEMWWEDWRFFPTNWHMRSDSGGTRHKKFHAVWNRLYGTSDNRTSCVAEIWPEGNDQTGRLRVSASGFVQSNVQEIAAYPGFIGNNGTEPIQLGVWTRWRAYYKMASSSTAKDGIVRMWAGTTRVINLTNVDFWPHADATDTHRYWRAGYLMGEATNGYSVSQSGASGTVLVAIDDPKIWYTNPGW